MTEVSSIKRSRIILALDLRRSNLQSALRTISLLERCICAIKLNFHLILPLSSSELSEVNRLVHSYGLQSVADIKLNDIPSTNKIAISHLLRMGFDAVTVNPFIGEAGLRAVVVQAHELKGGIIALVYMSHVGARLGFGINFLGSNNQVTSIYQKFFQDAMACHVDGVIVGANRLGVTEEVSVVDSVMNPSFIYTPIINVDKFPATLTRKARVNKKSGYISIRLRDLSSLAKVAAYKTIYDEPPLPLLIYKEKNNFVVGSAISLIESDTISYFYYVVLDEEPTSSFLRYSSQKVEQPSFSNRIDEHGYVYLKLIRLASGHPLVKICD